MEKIAILVTAFAVLISIGFLSSSFLSIFGNNEPNGEPPSINFFIVKPEIVNFGEASVLNWSVTGEHTEIIIEGEYVGYNGTQIIAANTNKTYNLTASNYYGRVNASVLVTVIRSTSSPIEFEVHERNNRLIVKQTDGNLKWTDISIISTSDLNFVACNSTLYPQAWSLLEANTLHAIVNGDVNNGINGVSNQLISESDFLYFEADSPKESTIIKIYHSSTHTLLGVYVIQSGVNPC